jgi:hypothetical protein
MPSIKTSKPSRRGLFFLFWMNLSALKKKGVPGEFGTPPKKPESQP